MSDSNFPEKNFLGQLTAIIEKNITNDQFGVSELADEMHMSRSNLLRKVKKETRLSVSQLINQVRLKRAMELLRKSAFNVTEVSHQVGFASPSYFIKCFRDYYGYPPGEVGKRPEVDELTAIPLAPEKNYASLKYILLSVGLAVALGIGVFSYYSSASTTFLQPSKSIAVLPFKNESSDSANVYLINGLMESTLNNLQQIKDLKVVSRTSVEKYRNAGKTIPEMAREMNVNYFVEGSGQKIGDRILLNIQLIDASTDRHLWARQYRREAKDIFALQQEIARNIADEIQAVVTPDEEKKIEKIPTKNLEAYDHFLKGKDLFYKSTRESLEASIPYFQKAIQQDDQFALAYANLVMVYYYLDAYIAEKKYTSEINSYADKAMLIDPKLEESLLAKGLAFAHRKEYRESAPYFEKALTINPRSGVVLHFLAELYGAHIPNTVKYLDYALKKVKLDNDESDSVTVSFNYQNLATAFLQAGFTDEAITNIDKSLTYNPKNAIATYIKIGTTFTKNKDFNQIKVVIEEELKRDTSQIILVHELGKVHYYLRDYKGALIHYRKFLAVREAFHLDIFRHENLRMGIVLMQNGLTHEGQQLIADFKKFVDQDRSVSQHLPLAMYYAHQKDSQRALDHLRLLAREDNFRYQVIIAELIDPVFDSIRNLPEFKKAMNSIEEKFWETHDEIKETLEEERM